MLSFVGSTTLIKYHLESHMLDRLIAVAVTIGLHGTNGCALFCYLLSLCFISIANMYLLQLFHVKILDKITILMKHSLKFGNDLWLGVVSVR